MPDIEKYEVLVIGSGEAGKNLAWTMAGEGHRTAVVERKLIGGSCPNIACLPSKNINPPKYSQEFSLCGLTKGRPRTGALTADRARTGSINQQSEC
jgi:choline dehydrogenase-like flavoprotein